MFRIMLERKVNANHLRHNRSLSSLSTFRVGLRNSVMRTTLLRHVLRRTAACSRPSPSNNDLHHAYARTVAPRSHDTSSRPHHPHRHGFHPSNSRRYSTYTSPHPAKPPRSGQPLGTTHPHLVRNGDLTPGIPASEYEERRRRLMASLPEGAVVVCMGGTVRLMSQRECLRRSVGVLDMSLPFRSVARVGQGADDRRNIVRLAAQVGRRHSQLTSGHQLQVSSR